MPFWRLFSCYPRKQYNSLDKGRNQDTTNDETLSIPEEVPPTYNEDDQVSISSDLALAAEISLYDALEQFCSECPEMSRNALNGNWGVKASAKIRKIELNLRTLRLIPPDGRIAWTRVDWYAELVIKWKADFRSPFLIQQLLVNF